MQKYLFLCVVAITIVSYLAQDQSNASPEVQPIDVPNNVYSGERAKQVLSSIIRQNAPHPTGSVEHLAVRNRITNWLDTAGIDYSIQKAWGCSNRGGRCALANNIIAKIPAETENPYVTLMAHYDSTPASDGAGDNGAGVATLLEIGRMLKDQTLTNPVMLLITDAEENGLLGAEAFFTQHKDRHNIGMVLNLEASTSSGRSFLFRTSSNNQTLVTAYGKTASRPGGTSLYNEVFKYMPSETDFAVPLRMGIPGMDFVFVGDKHHHHTPNDNLDNLSLQSLQHHGDNLYPLALHFATNPLSSPTEEATFLNLFGIWISWPSALNLVLLGIGLGLLLISIWRNAQDWRRVMAAAALPLAMFMSITLVSGLIFLLVHFANGTTPFWPAHLVPYRMMLFGIPFAMALILAPQLNSDFDQPHALSGIWFFWGILAIAFTIWLPAGAYLFLLPLCVAGAVLLGSSFLPETVRPISYLLTIPLVVALHLNLVILLEQSQGYWFIASTFLFLALFTASVMPLLQGILAKTTRLLMVGISVIGFAFAIALPGFSEQRPQTAIYQMVQNADTGKAWLQFLSLNTVPDEVAQLDPFTKKAAIFPWNQKAESQLKEVTPSELGAPRIEVVKESIEGQERTVSLRIHPDSSARDLGIVIPPVYRAASYTVGNQEYAFEPLDWGTAKDQHALEFRGVQGKAVDLTIRFEDPNPVDAHIYSITKGIPAVFDSLIEAREPLVVQVHQGDRTIAIRSVTF